uniref:Ig-like domain-containing protein n=1 Tax=Tetranychus urticae TaxID=32264 RepID=T1L646_TETUR
MVMPRKSQNFSVKWYKDFTLIDTETSFLRKMSTTLVRSNLPGRYVASLTMDKLYPLDSGIFTCEAFDWHSRVNSSYELKVFTKPQVKVYPLSATVYSAQPYTVSCFSLDYDPLIGYNWLKNGEILNPLYDDELIEDLYPAGIRLIVPKALTRAVYTCLVTTPLGTVGKESMLTVIPSNISSEFIQTCPKETHEDIDWPETAIDGIAVEPCPPGYKVDIIEPIHLSSDGGVARRKCFTSGKWDEADFSSCLNYQMFYIPEKFETLISCNHIKLCQ